MDTAALIFHYTLVPLQCGWVLHNKGARNSDHAISMSAVVAKTNKYLFWTLLSWLVSNMNPLANQAINRLP